MSVTDSTEAEPAGNNAASSNFAGRFTLLTIFAMAAFAIASTLSEQAGIPVVFLIYATGVLWCVAIVVTGFICRTPSLAQWQSAAVSANTITLAMSNSATLIPGVVFILLPGMFFISDANATALALGILAAAALAGIMFNPALRIAGTVTPFHLVGLRFPKKAVRAMLLLTLVVAALLLMWAELSIIMTVANLAFGVSGNIALIVAMILIALTVLPGGARGVLRLGVLSYVFLSAAFLAPLVWISINLSGVPVPQFAFGTGALTEIGRLEQAMTGIGIPLLESVVTGGPSQTGLLPPAFFTFVFAALGLSALPAVLGMQQTSESTAHTRRSGAWTLLLLGLVISAVPAASAFAKLSIYNSTLGLTTDEVAASTPWIIGWGNAAAANNSDAALVTLCTKAVTSPQMAVDACGGNPDHSITPNDLALRIEAIFLALPQAAGLPVIFFLLGAMSVLAAALATANATLFATANLFSRPIASDPQGEPVMRRLFLARMTATVLLLVCGVLAATGASTPLEVFLWALAIGAGAIAPALAVCLWVDRLGTHMILAGLGTALLILAAGFASGAWLASLPPAETARIATDAPVLRLLHNPVVMGLAAACGNVLAMGAAFLARRPARRSAEEWERSRLPGLSLPSQPSGEAM